MDLGKVTHTKTTEKKISFRLGGKPGGKMGGSTGEGWRTLGGGTRGGDIEVKKSLHKT